MIGAKNVAYAASYNNYVLLKLKTMAKKVKAQPGLVDPDKMQIKQYAVLKVTIFLLPSSTIHIRNRLDRAYRLVEAGCPVECRIPLRLEKKENRVEKLAPNAIDDWG